MKRLSDLKPSDLDRSSVWRYDGETDETAMVRATQRTELTAAEAETFIAKTQFALANGAQHVGFCSPTDDSGLDYLQPVIVTAAGPVFFYFEEPPSREFLAAQWSRLGAPYDKIFPIHFRCVVPVDGQFVSGTIEEVDLTGAA